MLLWIDYWKKYIWLAKKDLQANIIMPLWYIDNDWWTVFNISDLILRNKIEKIIIWRPKRQKDIQEIIEKFIKELKFVFPEMEIEKINEDYSSVQACATMWDFKKNKWKEDCIAAMKILERVK